MSVLETLLIRVRGETRDYETAMRRVKGETAQTEKSMSGLMSTSFSLRNALVGIGAVGYVGKQLFDIGSAAEETASKFTTVFGGSTDAVQGFIDQFGTLAGLSNEQAQAVLATTGSIVQGMGFAEEASAQFATEVVQLAGDLSSFNNVPIEETSRAIQAALTGEREQLKRLGIVLREADVQQRALAMSGKSAVSALTDQDRAAASLQLITERAGVAVGDLARTQDSAANRARQLGAEIQNVKETIGTALLPVISFAVEGFNAFIKGLQIMAAESAVFIGRINVMKEGFFGSAEAEEAAALELYRLMVAADEVKNAIIGLTFDLEGANQALRDNTAAADLAAQSNVNLSGMLVERTAPAVEAVSMRVLDMTERIRQTAEAFGDLQPLAVESMARIGNAGDVLAGNFASMVGGLVDGSKNIVDAIAAMAKQIIADFVRIIAKAVIVRAILGAVGVPVTGPILSLASIPGRASGGPVNAGQPYLVGERGPEIIVPNQSGQVIPNGGGAAMAQAWLENMPQPPEYASPEVLANSRYHRAYGAALVRAMMHDGVSFAT